MYASKTSSLCSSFIIPSSNRKPRIFLYLIIPQVPTDSVQWWMYAIHVFNFRLLFIIKADHPSTPSFIRISLQTVLTVWIGKSSFCFEKYFARNVLGGWLLWETNTSLHIFCIFTFWVQITPGCDVIFILPWSER